MAKNQNKQKQKQAAMIEQYAEIRYQLKQAKDYQAFSKIASKILIRIA